MWNQRLMWSFLRQPHKLMSLTSTSAIALLVAAVNQWFFRYFWTAESTSLPCYTHITYALPTRVCPKDTLMFVLFFLPDNFVRLVCRQAWYARAVYLCQHATPLCMFWHMLGSRAEQWKGWRKESTRLFLHTAKCDSLLNCYFLCKLSVCFHSCICDVDG